MSQEQETHFVCVLLPAAGPLAGASRIAPWHVPLPFAFWSGRCQSGHPKTRAVCRYSTLKRLTPIIVLLFNVAVTRTWPAAGLTASVLCVVAGCIVAAIGDLTFDAMGYLFALVSCCLQAIYLLLVGCGLNGFVLTGPRGCSPLPDEHVC